MSATVQDLARYLSTAQIKMLFTKVLTVYDQGFEIDEIKQQGQNTVVDIILENGKKVRITV